MSAVLWPNWKLLLAFPELTDFSWLETTSCLVNLFWSSLEPFRAELLLGYAWLVFWLIALAIVLLMTYWSLITEYYSYGADGSTFGFLLMATEWATYCLAALSCWTRLVCYVWYLPLELLLRLFVAFEESTMPFCSFDSGEAPAVPYAFCMTVLVLDALSTPTISSCFCLRGRDFSFEPVTFWSGTGCTCFILLLRTFVTCGTSPLLSCLSTCLNLKYLGVTIVELTCFEGWKFFRTRSCPSYRFLLVVVLGESTLNYWWRSECLLVVTIAGSLLLSSLILLWFYWFFASLMSSA